jgi:uncharacterized protein (TIGR02598 family)
MTLEKGFTLIELVIAISIAGFCLISMIGLLEAGIKESRRASAELEASNILSVVYGNIGTNTNNRSITSFYNEFGDAVGTDDIRAKYKVSLIVINGITNIKIWWPANASIDNSEGMLEIVTCTKY